jgi:superfamily I DNA and/or RNA helicase
MITNINNLKNELSHHINRFKPFICVDCGLLRYPVWNINTFKVELSFKDGKKICRICYAKNYRKSHYVHTIHTKFCRRRYTIKQKRLIIYLRNKENLEYSDIKVLMNLNSNSECRRLYDNARQSLKYYKDKGVDIQ